MTSSPDHSNGTTTSRRERRPHDARASRQALLDAAAGLFDARGYDRTTVRDIGESAGVDPALITRYFGGKEGLYLAVLTDQDRAGTAPTYDPDPMALARVMLERWDERKGGPLISALVNPHPSPEVRDQVRAILAARTIGPLAAELTDGGNDPAAHLRAEVLLAMLAGVVLARANGTLEELAGADSKELLELLGPALEEMRG